MRKILLGVIFIVVVLVVLCIGVLGLLYPLNSTEPQNPDLSCNTDSDCVLHIHPDWSQCRLCDSCNMYDINDTKVIAVNKNWAPFCPFPKPASTICVACVGGIRLPPDASSYIRCIDSICQKVLP